MSDWLKQDGITVSSEMDGRASYPGWHARTITAKS